MRISFIVLFLSIFLVGCSSEPPLVESNIEFVTAEEMAVTALPYTQTSNTDSCFLLSSTDAKHKLTVLTDASCFYNKYLNLLPMCNEALSLTYNDTYYTVGFYNDGDYQDKSLSEVLADYPMEAVNKYILSYMTGEAFTGDTSMSVKFEEERTLECRGVNRDYTYYTCTASVKRPQGNTRTTLEIPYSVTTLDLEDGNYIVIGGLQLSDDMLSLYKYCYLNEPAPANGYKLTLVSEAQSLLNLFNFLSSSIIYGDRSQGLDVLPTPVTNYYKGLPLDSQKNMSTDLVQVVSHSSVKTYVNYEENVDVETFNAN